MLKFVNGIDKNYRIVMGHRQNTEENEITTGVKNITVMTKIVSMFPCA